MKERGYTLIEAVLSAILLSYMLIYILNFLFYNKIFMKKLEYFTDLQENMSIASDFLYENIVKAKDIKINNDSFYIDGKKVYVKNNILRFDTDSQQIAYGIKKIQIKSIENNYKLYMLTIYGENTSKTFYVKLRGELYD